MIFLSVFSFYLHNLEEFRAWMAEKGTNSYNKKVLASQYGWGAGGGGGGGGGGGTPPLSGGCFAPCAPGPAPYPHTPPLSPYILGPPGLAWVASDLCTYTRWVELYAQNCIK